MNTRIEPMPLWVSAVMFGVPTVVFYIATRLLIPLLDSSTAVHPALLWFAVGGVVVFIPLFITALVAARMDGFGTSINQVMRRLRLSRMTAADWLWALIATVLILVLTMAVMAAANALLTVFGLPPLQTSPPFLHFDPLVGGQRWILLAWIPFFFFNIMGEEMLWRGYILPRQELSHGSFAWLLNSLLWLVFHLCFGWQVVVVLLPILFILPYVVQKRGNTWIGVVIHALVNGPAFVMVSLGLVG